MGRAHGPAHAPDAQEVGDLYRRYAPMVYRRCSRFFGPQEAEDAMHEVFLKVFSHLDGFRGEASPSTWLYRVATNVCLKKLYKQERRRELWQAHGAEACPASVQRCGQEAALALQQLWRLLPEELVQVGVYHFVDGMTQQEIAELMGVSRRTVGNRLDELKVNVQALARQEGR